MRGATWLLLILLLFGGSLLAQNRIAGRVIDANSGDPLTGATVLIKGTTKGAYTDGNGEFSFSVSESEVNLVVSFLGYNKTELIVPAGSTDLTIELEAKDSELDEVVLIGYGSTEKEDVTGSIVSVSSKEFQKGNLATPEQLIQGKVPGVQITANGGAPGAGSRIRIRGGASLNASNDPLIVIDGVPVDNGGINGAPNPLSLINPNDIETFTVLKDASATAIYGSRASNGVIIITTKQGKAGQSVRVNYNGVLSLAQNRGQVDVLTADEFREQVALADTVGSRVPLLGDANTNWQDEIYRDAISQDHNVSVTGAVGTMPYRVSAGYFDQNGTLKRANLKRYSGALSLNPSLFDDHLRVDVNVKASLTDNFFANGGAIGSAIAFDPTQPVFSGDTAFGGYFEYVNNNGQPNNLAPRNPVGLLMQREDESQVLRSIGNVAFDYRFHFLPELRANVNWGYDVSRSEGSVFVPAEAASLFTRDGQQVVYNQERNNYILDAYLNYVKEFEAIDHKLDLMGGFSNQTFNAFGDPGEYSLDLPLTEDPDTAFFNAPLVIYDEQGNVIDSTSLRLPYGGLVLRSYYGRLNYTIKNRYLLTATLRADISSRFSPDYRLGLFPAVAFAWKMSEEAFIQDIGAISNLKLRLGYGITGQQEVGGIAPYLARFTPSLNNAFIQFGDRYVQTLRPEGYDETLKWEETTTYNAGLDFGFFDERITGSLDYYFRETRDLLASIPVPALSNFTNQILTNVGSIENQGFEAIVSFNPVRSANWNVNLGFNLAYNQNRITSLSRVESDTAMGNLVGGIAGGVGNTIQIHTVGFPTNSFFVLEQNYDEQGDPIQGDYVDRNGDGEVNLDDRYRFENPNPDYILGINGDVSYRNFSLSFVLRGNFGQWVYNNVRSDKGTYQPVYNSVPFLTNMHQDVINSRFDGPEYFSDFYLERADFLRLDNLVLGYSLPDLANGRFTAQVSLIGQNLFVLSNYSGLDPEVAGGIDNNFFPVPRTLSLSVNLGFQ
mgnify:CR=1 FL=1